MLRRRRLAGLALILAVAVGGAAAAEAGIARPGVGAGPTPIRIGWQTAWATQGQIVEALKHTNALAAQGLSATFDGFSYGGPLNLAALAGKEDVIFTADQPAAALLAAGAKWEIVARLMYNRVSIYVPPDSPIKTISDLRGKTIGIPFGAAAQREALRAIQRAGLDPQKDIKAVNLDIYTQVPIIERGTPSSWGTIDAFVGFDPVPAAFQQRNLARILYATTVVAVVMLSRDFIDHNPSAPERFLRAYGESYYYYARHQLQAGGWFVRDSRLPFGADVLGLSAAVEPNVSVKKPGDLRLALSKDDIDRMQSGIDFLYAQKLIASPIKFRDYIDQTYLDRAVSWLRAHAGVFARTRPTA